VIRLNRNIVTGRKDNMTLEQLKENDPLFYNEFLKDDIKDAFDGDLNITLKEIAQQFDLPTSVVQEILMEG
tara:strand:+ start:61 stop:273 length:213 start_codon:yes stop_codon:yes gene_type:complete